MLALASALWRIGRELVVDPSHVELVAGLTTIWRT
jgi:hypothetical protein